MICPKISGKGCQTEIRCRHAKITNSSHPSPEASSSFCALGLYPYVVPREEAYVVQEAAAFYWPEYVFVWIRRRPRSAFKLPTLSVWTRCSGGTMSRQTPRISMSVPVRTTDHKGQFGLDFEPLVKPEFN